MTGFSGKNAYGMTLYCQTEDFNDLFELSINCFLKPSMTMKNIAHEKEMTLRNLESQKEDPTFHCFSIINQTMFPNHPYNLNPLGNKQAIKRLSRKRLKEIHDKNLNTNELLFTYCGDLELSEVTRLLHPYTAQLKSRSTKRSIIKKYTPLEDQIIHMPFDREQTQIFIGIPSGKLGTVENIYLNMLTTHLGGQSSELFVDVRDKQALCYSIQPVNFVAVEGGYWGIYMASGHDKAVSAINSINNILDKIRDRGITEKEFERIKSMIEGQNLISIQTNDDYANIYSIPALHGFGVDHFYENNEKINALSYIDFQKSIKRILSKKRNTILVGREIKD
jgi:zinc protease